MLTPGSQKVAYPTRGIGAGGGSYGPGSPNSPWTFSGLRGSWGFACAAFVGAVGAVAFFARVFAMNLSGPASHGGCERVEGEGGGCREAFREKCHHAPMP